jgi:hypothetical protein
MQKQNQTAKSGRESALLRMKSMCFLIKMLKKQWM